MISIVSPVFNSESCLEELIERIVFNTNSLSSEIEIILIDDGSVDRSWKKIKELKKKYNFIKGIKLNKNYGQHKAIYTGIRHSSKDLIIIMDCDLQDDPIFIKEMYKSYIEEKKPIIIQHSYEDIAFKNRIVSTIFWRILSLISLKNFSPNLGNYMLIDKRMRDKYLSINTIGYLYGDLILQKNIFSLIKKKRSTGIRKKTTYNFLKLLSLGVNLILKYNILSRLFIDYSKRKIPQITTEEII